MSCSIPLPRSWSLTWVPRCALFGASYWELRLTKVPEFWSAVVQSNLWFEVADSAVSAPEPSTEPLFSWGPWSATWYLVDLKRVAAAIFFTFSLHFRIHCNECICTFAHPSGQSAIAGEEHPKGPILQEVHLRFLLTGLLSGLPSPQFAIRMCPPLTTKNIKVYQPLLAVGKYWIYSFLNPSCLFYVL